MNKVRRLERKIARLERKQLLKNEKYDFKIENLYLEKNYFENLYKPMEDWKEYEVYDKEK